MNWIILLLAIIAISELSRLFMTHVHQTSKKGHFKLKLQQTSRMIWDLEFKRFKTLEIREEVRKEYDHAKSALEGLEQALKSDKIPKEEKPGYQDKVDLAKRDVERFESQLRQLDLEIEGSKPTNELPDGYQGLSHQIDSLQELRLMLKSWIKSL